jgi:hypothetical protein
MYMQPRMQVMQIALIHIFVIVSAFKCRKLSVVKDGEVKSDLEKASLNNAWLVVSKLAAALFLRP